MHFPHTTPSSNKLVQLRTECDAMMQSLQGNARVDWNDLESMTMASVELGACGMEVLMFASMSHHNFEAASLVGKNPKRAFALAAEARQDALDDLAQLQQLAMRIRDQAPVSHLLNKSMPVVVSFAEDMLAYWSEVEQEYAARLEARMHGGAGKSFAYSFRA